MKPDKKSNCERQWGYCLQDPRCQDTLCPGHPSASCSTCDGGPCYTPLACHTPIGEVPVRIERRLFAQPAGLLPTTHEGWGRFIGAALGIAGFFFIFGHVGRYLGLF